MSRIMFRFWLDDTKQDENELIEEVSNLKQQRSFSKTIRDGIRLVNSLTSGSLSVLFELFPFVRAEFMDYVQEQITNTVAAQNEQLQQRVIELEAENAALKERNIGLQAVIEENEEYIEELETENDKLQKEQPAETSTIQKQLSRLEELLLQQGNVPIQSASSAGERRSIGSPGDGLQPITLDKPQNSSGPQTLNVPQFSTPSFDDEGEEEGMLLEVKRDEAAGDIAVQNFLKSAMGLQEHYNQ